MFYISETYYGTPYIFQFKAPKLIKTSDLNFKIIFVILVKFGNVFLAVIS